MLAPVVAGWRADGLLAPDVPVDDVAAAVVTLVPALIVSHQLVGDLDARRVVSGLAGLGTALGRQAGS